MTTLKKSYSIVLIVVLASIISAVNMDYQRLQVSGPTGIQLDTLGNEIYLAIIDDVPDHYYSNIFTPVCETGECKPIYINLYWDLNGNYLRFDFPEGQILTKKDHVPFTAADYELLDEILGGEDPRSGLAKSSPSEGSSSEGVSPSAPVPQSSVVSKNMMVDGITGSTLPDYKDRFVPGALYTTYTIWDLANSHQLDMMYHTKSLIEKRE